VSRGEAVRQLRAGMFLVAALGLLMAAVFLLGRSQTLFARRVRLHTAFANTGGLMVGAPVRLAGVDIGTVAAIAFDRDLRERRVRVTLSVERRFLDRIRADSVAHLASKGLLGDMLIDITVGSPEAQRVHSGSTLQSAEGEGMNALIASIQLAIGDLRSLTGTLNSRVKAVLTDTVARDLSRIAHATAAILERAEGTRVLADVSRMSREVAGAARALRGGTTAMADLGHVSRTLRQIGDDLQQGKGTLGALLKDPSIYEDVKIILGNVKRSRVLRALVRYTIKRDGLKRE
jgi:phospholipid/cholesterol/gamma-HCH transport system substrate-binding protein